ncbi:ABC transporter G family member 44-like isoform X2 [Phoenix dactylifera]|uniref:ABC transporter G family member 44-like isoform X2 n=1 Tax=Phoenix dactylifera TaxID=42345 RepID=A0A8B8ZVJ4_PHODC|nr:ABC transporter G family member 44-like isoform X2 [Phoenix dactylifera]
MPSICTRCESCFHRRGIFTEAKWYWIGTGALAGYTILFNILFTVALTYIKPYGNAQPSLSEEALHEKYTNITGEMEPSSLTERSTSTDSTSKNLCF